MNTAALYVHLPFCKSRCAYCDFFSTVPEHGSAVPDSYLKALAAEYLFRKKQFSPAGFSTVYVGGGTPSLLTPAQFAGLSALWKQDAGVSGTPCRDPADTPRKPEITVECNPDDITPALLETVAACGFTRISAGIQILDGAALGLINRRAGIAASLNALELLRDKWYPRNFSVDMMTGLPGVSAAVFDESLRRVLDFNPFHVSLYSLMLEENTPLYRQVRLGTVPYSDDENDAQWIAGRDILEHRGFRQYEVSNFTKPGYESMHNLTYWRMQPYIGIGAGATGTVGTFRYTNICDVGTYIRFWTENGDPIEAQIPQECELLTDEVCREEFLMMGFRTLEGVSAGEYRRRFDRELSDDIGAVFSEWERKHCARQHHGRYALTADGLLFLNTFLRNIL